MFKIYFPNPTPGTTLYVLLQQSSGSVLGSDTQAFTLGLINWCVAHTSDTLMQASDVTGYYTLLQSPMPALADTLLSTNGDATLLLVNYFGTDIWMNANIGRKRGVCCSDSLHST